FGPLRRPVDSGPTRSTSGQEAHGAPRSEIAKEMEMSANMRGTLVLAALAALAGSALAAPAPPAAAGKDPSAAFERLKGLVGAWVGAEDGEMSKKGALVARYALPGGGTALVEPVFPGSAREMVTVYHADGNDLVLPHYCMEGNQPRMRARHATG